MVESKAVRHMAAETPEVTSIVPHTVKAMAPEQTEQILRWYAAGHSPSDIVDFAENEFALILDKSEARLIWTDNRPKIAEFARMSLVSMRQNPYFEPAFIVAKLNMLLFRLEEMLDNSMREGAPGPTSKLVDVFLRVIGQMEKFQPAEGTGDPGGTKNWDEMISNMDEVDASKVRRLLGEINETLGRYKKSGGG